MDVIAFVNKKGGVGKSRRVMHLGGSLAHRGKRVLWVDVDPQASLAQGLIGPAEALGPHPRYTLAGLHDESAGATIRQIIRRFDARPNLALIPGHDRMTHYNVPDPWTTDADQYLVRDALDEVAGDHDIALLDCPPNIQARVWAALLVANFVVVPAQVEDHGVRGVSMILDSIDHARRVANPWLRLLGFCGQNALDPHQPHRRPPRRLWGGCVRLRGPGREGLQGSRDAPEDRDRVQTQVGGVQGDRYRSRPEVEGCCDRSSFLV